MGEVARAENAIQVGEAQEAEKEILDEIERKIIQNEEATLLSLMDREAAEDAEIQFNELRYIDIDFAEERVVLLNKTREKEKDAFLKKMDEATRAEKAIEIAAEQETAADLEIESEILDERERMAIQREEATLLDLMDREGAEEAEAEFNEPQINDVYHAEKIAAFLNEAKEKEKADFLRKMDGIARAKMALEVLEAQKTAKYLEIENEILDEWERKAVQRDEATLLSLMDREAAVEDEMVFHQWPDIDSFLVEERAAHIDKVSEKEKADFLKKMDAVSKELIATGIAESQETAIDLETEKEILDEIERAIIQKEEAIILNLMDQEAAEENDVESIESQDIDSYLAKDRDDFLKIMEEKMSEEADLENYLDKKRTTQG